MHTFSVNYCDVNTQAHGKPHILHTSYVLYYNVIELLLSHEIQTIYYSYHYIIIITTVGTRYDM